MVTWLALTGLLAMVSTPHLFDVMLVCTLMAFSHIRDDVSNKQVSKQAFSLLAPYGGARLIITSIIISIAMEA